MPELIDVIPGEPVAAEWGNDVRDRTVQRYAGATQRGTLHPSPTPGDLSYLADTGEVSVYHSGGWRAFLPPGVVLPYAGGSVPPGFLVCDGSAVSRTTYAALFAAVGVVFGAGDGSSTFNLPDLRGRFPLGVAPSGTGSALGAAGGSIDHTHGATHSHDAGSLAAASGGAHTHPSSTTGGSGQHAHVMPATTDAAGSHSHSFSDTTSGPSGTATAAGATENFPSTSHTHSVSGTTGSGGSHSHGIPSPITGSGDHTHSVPAAASAGAHTHTVAGSSGSTGVTTTGTNPPFLALHYIIRT